MAPDQASMKQSFLRAGALNSAGGPCAAFAAVASITVANCEQRKLKLAVPVYLES